MREAIVCDGDGRRVRLCRGALCLECDLSTGRYSITYGEACAIEGAEAVFTADGRTIQPASQLPHRWRLTSKLRTEFSRRGSPRAKRFR